ncbi:carbonic anhydrase [Aetokthonos hydrillicola]|jgi:carbonic anhydrase|uniref:carbonic anhydrase n=1 Tax=Aetokthonos hydrillicola TaxID=1550245 RepID=UPI001ABAE6BF|nr:carbonic anhydrase [Aetokthonos hydrillicola]MBO3459048.1 carbonic anhydrase [Aetokthonos hydrillicola CCALA 1050]MBW4584780.1 carbonic anhydrase [Aetokthonos hydrillicola CCALA 1050]
MEKLTKGVQDFKVNHFSTYREIFEQLSVGGQHPRILFITCSDSRITPSLITQTQPGELFIIRNAGNIIPPYGTTNCGEGATVEYAVQALEIKHIIVCGHTHCGAIKGLLHLNSLPQDMPLLYDWLKYAQPTNLRLQQRYQEYEGEDLLNAAIEENVLTQIENLQTYPAIQAKLDSGTLNIHAWVYKIRSGEVLAYTGDHWEVL